MSDMTNVENGASRSVPPPASPTAVQSPSREEIELLTPWSPPRSWNEDLVLETIETLAIWMVRFDAPLIETTWRSLGERCFAPSREVGIAMLHLALIGAVELRATQDDVFFRVVRREQLADPFPNGRRAEL